MLSHLSVSHKTYCPTCQSQNMLSHFLSVSHKTCCPTCQSQNKLSHLLSVSYKMHLNTQTTNGFCLWNFWVYYRGFKSNTLQHYGIRSSMTMTLKRSNSKGSGPPLVSPFTEVSAPVVFCHSSPLRSVPLPKSRLQLFSATLLHFGQSLHWSQCSSCFLSLFSTSVSPFTEVSAPVVFCHFSPLRSVPLPKSALQLFSVTSLHFGQSHYWLRSVIHLFCVSSLCRLHLQTGRPVYLLKIFGVLQLAKKCNLRPKSVICGEHPCGIIKHIQPHWQFGQLCAWYMCTQQNQIQ